MQAHSEYFHLILEATYIVQSHGQAKDFHGSTGCPGPSTNIADEVAVLLACGFRLASAVNTFAAGIAWAGSKERRFEMTICATLFSC
jgi:hypothetical protein